MKVILLNPPSCTYRQPEEHLGLAYLKAYISRENFDCEIVDAFIRGWSSNQVISFLKSKKFEILGVSPSLDSLAYAVEISEEIKKIFPQIKICWGGHLATFSAQDLMQQHHCIDYIVRGEGEATLRELLRALQGLIKEEEILGLVFRRGKRIIVNPPRPLIANLDSLPFPARDYTFEVYQQGALVHISASRGCYGRCSFCSINSLYRLSEGKTWRGRTPFNVVEELEELYGRGFREFKFVDDSFFGPDKEARNRVKIFAQEIIKRGIDIKFRISVRVNNVDFDTFKLLRQAGLYSVSLGVESGVQRMLNTFKKGTSVEQNYNAIQILQELGIITLMGFIGFDPYITLEELEENLFFLHRTTHCLCDLVSKPLYVHARDEITQQLLQDGLLDGRDFPNYTYQIQDIRARRVFKHLQWWNSFNRSLYYKVSDPLTAPRRTTLQQERILRQLHKILRLIDLHIFAEVVKMVKTGEQDASIERYLRRKLEQYKPVWQQIGKRFDALF